MEHTYTAFSAEETRGLGRDLSRFLVPGRTLVFSGELGAGKTTLIQGILEGLGARGPFVSPTFVLMKEYALPEPVSGITRVYHADAYRVTEKDFAALGFEEWVRDPEGLVLIEWPERLGTLVPAAADRVHLRALPGGEREIIWNKAS
jgi:tRNA threonylcarbamoyladenosine biosynthesis protein TsaE